MAIWQSMKTGSVMADFGLQSDDVELLNDERRDDLGLLARHGEGAGGSGLDVVA